MYNKNLKYLMIFDVSATNSTTTYIPLTLYPQGVAEVSQIFLRHTHALPKLVSYKRHCRRDRW
jgi:hypothetical protein